MLEAWRGIRVRAAELGRQLVRDARQSRACRIMTIPGIGPIGATALAASITDPRQFRSGRQFAAWLGLTPLQKSSGGKGRLGRITKMGDKYLRKLLIVGTTSLVRRAKYNPKTVDPRLADLLARKPVRVATVAMANNTARIVWAVIARGDLSCRSAASIGDINQRFQGLAEEEISFTLRERCDVMANRSDRNQGQPTACPRRQSLISRMGPRSRTPSGAAVSTDCVNRPDRRLHPTKATHQFNPCNAGAIHRRQAGLRPRRQLSAVERT
jgi:hypothetical protein